MTGTRPVFKSILEEKKTPPCLKKDILPRAIMMDFNPIFTKAE